jgi:hypothetical protein
MSQPVEDPIKIHPNGEARPATQEDLDQLEARLVMKISGLLRDSNRSRIEQHEYRIAQLEKARS